MHRLPCEAEFIDPAPESIAREQNLIIWSSSAAAAALRHQQADGSRARLFGEARPATSSSKEQELKEWIARN